MKWEVSKTLIINDNGDSAFIVCHGATEKNIRQTVHAEDAFSAIKEFVDDVNAGKLKPRATVKKFQSLLDKVS